MRRRLITTPRFQRDGRRLLRRQPSLEPQLLRVLSQLAEDAFAPGLRTHKLKGDLADRWSCSAGYDLRIVFRLGKDDRGDLIELLSIGTHDEVY